MRAILLLLPALLAWAAPALAATGPAVRGHAVEGRLIVAEAGVAGATLSGGLALEMDPGWKTYWRSPGQVGLPPALDWSGSDNVAGVEIAYPVPQRFDAFDIENYGYADAVTYPLAIRVADPAAPARLRLRADLLVCAEICVPETLELALDVPAGGGVDPEAAAALAPWIGRVPGTEGFRLEAVHLDGAALTLRARADAPLDRPAVFPERDGAAFGPPQVQVSADGRTLWARLPVLAEGEGPLDLTLASGDAAATLRAELAAAPPAPPAAGVGGAAGGVAGGTGLWAILAVAALGGLILNAMPCVLPVLTIKLASALQARDRAPAEVRAGFLAAAAGVLAFFAALALAVVAARAAGLAVGWGVQFQQPAFLALMAGLMTLFAANLWGLFDVALPSGAATALGRAGGRAGRWGDFATGAFAAVMATPCSAPFIGTAVAYALTRGPGATLAVFLAMGAGLAAPYLLVAARPGLVRLLPRPGRWMATLRAALGGLMALAALWVLWVLWQAAGPWAAAAGGAACAALVLALRAWRRPAAVAPLGLAALVAAATLAPAGGAAPAGEADWAPLDRGAINAAVARGETVFVDVTAAWCLTCQANKRLVLDRAPVRAALAEAVAMRGDWTRPDPAIADFLAGFDRYGIPFNAVYGPGAPDGLPLPELLTEGAVLDALARAGGA